MNCKFYETLFEGIKPYTLSIVSIYLVSIFRLLEHREQHNIIYDTKKIRPWFHAWCAMLSIYSVITFLGMTQTAKQLWISGSWISQTTTMDWREKDECCFWVTTFFLSKFIELGDSFFIIFLNKRLILLQWFHHMTTLLYVQEALSERRFSSFWFIYMNLFVHSIMYAYYVKAFIRPWIITFFQILQMIIGLSIVILDRKEGFDIYGCTMYGLYFYLFSEYFVNRYIYNNRHRE